MSELCATCEQRSVCKYLCPEAALYADQDKVTWAKEGTGDFPVDEAFDASQKTMPDANMNPLKYMRDNPVKVRFTPREAEFLMYYVQGYTAKEIQEKMNIKRTTCVDLFTAIRKKGNF